MCWIQPQEGAAELLPLVRALPAASRLLLANSISQGMCSLFLNISPPSCCVWRDLICCKVLGPIRTLWFPLDKAAIAPFSLLTCSFCILLQLIGLGPHNTKKKQDLDKLYDLKAKAQQIMNQFGPSTLINLSNFSSGKPEPASTPPQSSMANSTVVAKMPGTPSGGGRLSPESNQVILSAALGQQGRCSDLPEA